MYRSVMLLAICVLIVSICNAEELPESFRETEPLVEEPVYTIVEEPRIHMVKNFATDEEMDFIMKSVPKDVISSSASPRLSSH